MTASLPPPPSEMEDSVSTEWTFRGGADTKLSGGGGMNRKTLDVCLDDEEMLGLWVAALRGLATEIRTKPTAYPSPFAPLHASAEALVRKAAPSDATCLERFRDASLKTLAVYASTKVFVGLTLVWGLAVVVFGALYFFLIVGWHSFPVLVCDDSYNVTALADALGGIGGGAWPPFPPSPPPDPNCGKSPEANYYANISIQILTAQFSYILALTLPWRLANAHHLWCSHRASSAGLDFYGRPTSGIWFHIKPRQRKVVVLLLNLNAAMQYATQATRFVWSSYDASQTMPGVLWINLTFVLSILCGIGSGIAQGKFEEGVRKNNPGRFPPTPLEFARAVWKREREQIREMLRESRQPPPEPPANPLRRLSQAVSRRVSLSSSIASGRSPSPGPQGCHPSFDASVASRGSAAVSIARYSGRGVASSMATPSVMEEGEGALEHAVVEEHLGRGGGDRVITVQCISAQGGGGAVCRRCGHGAGAATERVRVESSKTQTIVKHIIFVGRG